MKSTLLKSLISIACCICAALTSIGQVTTSSMSGRVTDDKDIAVPGATVLAMHTPSGTQYYAITDNSGNYRILNMRVGGPYKVTISLVGFAKSEHDNVSIALADNYVLDATLKQESISLDEVVVTAESATSNMNSNRAGAVTTIDKNTINSMPTISRQVSDLVKLTPQVFNSTSGPQIGGGSYRQNFFTVDGAAFNNAFGIGESMPSQGSPISLDAIEQISISVTPYDVRQSGFIGGSLNAVTRSGSNMLSASAYSYYYNDRFRGNRVEDNRVAISDGTNLVYGARIGGPILKNKLFFFVSLERESITQPGPTAVASSASRPYTDGNNGIARPTDTEMNTMSDYLSKTYGYDAGSYQGYSSKSPGYKLLARLDWNISQNHSFNIRYTSTKKKSPNLPSTSTSGLGDRNRLTGSRTNMTALFFQNARYYQETNFSSIAGELNSRFFEGKLNNVLRATYSHQDEPRSTEGGTFPFVDIGKDGSYFTSFGTELFSYGNLRDVQTYNITDEVSWGMGMHSFLAGLQFEHNITKNGFQRFGTGYYQYDSWDAFVAGQPHQFAITHSMNQDFSQAFPTFKFNQLSIYLQDEMKINKNFKLLAGIRFEMPMYPELDTYSEQVANTVLADHNGNGGKYNTTQLPSTKLLFSPRAGFNWDILGNRNVVMRGGTGLFTGRLPFVWIVAQAGDSGVLQATYTAVEGDGKVLPTFNADRTNLLKQIYPNGPSAATVPISSISLMSNDLKMPQTWKTSLAVDVKLPFGIQGSLEGIYNYDVNPVTITNVGFKEPVKTQIPGFADNRNYYGERYDNTLRDAYLLVNAKKRGYYYSLTAKLEKNNYKGLSAMIAYTYSKAKSLGDGWGDQMYSAWQNASTVNGNNTQTLDYAGYVMPHRIIGSLSYRKDNAAVSLFYEGGPQGRLSYVYTANVLGDGGAANLIYVPKSKDELTFKDYTPSGWREVYTKEAQAEDFWNFINNDKYLSTRKGQHAERNGLVYPWSHQFDVKFTYDFVLSSKPGNRHAIQLGFDILNFGNLLSKNWGNKWYYTRNNVLNMVENRYSATGTNVPVYQFQAAGTTPLREQFAPNVSTTSTYQMQLNIRYIFN
jgi:hypothetical protein